MRSAKQYIADQLQLFAGNDGTPEENAAALIRAEEIIDGLDRIRFNLPPKFS